MFILSLLSFIVIFSIVVFVHEFGHYIVARWNGVKVQEFAIGLPPRAKVIRKNKNGTEFTLNYIPFGGYVKMYGEDYFDKKNIEKKGSFAGTSIIGRMQIVIAGVVMNFLLAWGIFSLLFTMGTKPLIMSSEDLDLNIKRGYVVMEEFEGLKIMQFTESSKGEDAGLELGDIIVSIDGNMITKDNFSDFQKPLKTSDFEVIRGEDTVKIPITPNENGKIGAMLSDKGNVQEIKEIKLSFVDSVGFAFKECIRIGLMTIDFFGDMILNLVSEGKTPDEVSGPIGMAQMSGMVVHSGDFNMMLKFIALISLSLAVINILPIPALDGGHLTFLLIEAIIGRRLNKKVGTIASLIGFVFLISLMVIVSIGDLFRLFT